MPVITTVDCVTNLNAAVLSENLTASCIDTARLKQ